MSTQRRRIAFVLVAVVGGKVERVVSAEDAVGKEKEE